ncbi:MAG: helix-turn-helix domain-containing protein [Firmicutes bacterium]|nr:helix-turn-helix domain-containing protein [Bacillota bacterium]
MNKFAERLVEVLSFKGIAQVELSRRLEVGQATVNAWCTGTHEPNFDMLVRICRELDESADYLLGLKDE